MKRINAILAFLKFVGKRFNIIKDGEVIEEAIIIEETILRRR